MRVSNKENVTSAGVGSGLDLSNLSETDIVKLREVLGISSVQNEHYADENDITSVFCQPLDNLPNIHVEVDRADISDTEIPGENIADNLTQALFEPEDGEIVDWDLPRMKVPEKGRQYLNR